MELGTHAFNDNTLDNIILDYQDGFIIAKNVYNHILCFFCQEKCRKGFMMAKIEALAKALYTQLEPLKIHQFTDAGVNEDDEEGKADDD